MKRLEHREAFLEYQRRVFSDSIVKAHQESTHLDSKGSRSVNLSELSARLGTLMKSGMKEGMEPSEFEDLVYSLLPELRGRISLAVPVRKAA